MCKNVLPKEHRPRSHVHAHIPINCSLISGQIPPPNGINFILFGFDKLISDLQRLKMIFQAPMKVLEIRFYFFEVDCRWSVSITL